MKRKLSKINNVNNRKSKKKNLNKTSKLFINNRKKSTKKLKGGKESNDQIIAKYILEFAKKSLENNRKYLIDLLVNDELLEILKTDYSDSELEHIMNLYANKKYEDISKMYDKSFADRCVKLFASVEEKLVKIVFPEKGELDKYLKATGLDYETGIRALWTILTMYIILFEDNDNIKMYYKMNELKENTYKEKSKHSSIVKNETKSFLKKKKASRMYRNYLGGTPPAEARAAENSSRADDVALQNFIQEKNLLLGNSSNIILIMKFYDKYNEYCKNQNLKEAAIRESEINDNIRYLGNLNNSSNKEDERLIINDLIIKLQNLKQYTLIKNLYTESEQLMQEETRYKIELSEHNRLFKRTFSQVVSVKRATALLVVIGCSISCGLLFNQLEAHESHHTWVSHLRPGPSSSPGEATMVAPILYAGKIIMDGIGEYRKPAPTPPRRTSQDIIVRIGILETEFRAAMFEIGIDIKNYVVVFYRNLIENRVVNQINDQLQDTINSMMPKYNMLKRCTTDYNFNVNIWDLDFPVIYKDYETGPNQISQPGRITRSKIHNPPTLQKLRGEYNIITSTASFQIEKEALANDLRELNFREKTVHCTEFQPQIKADLANIQYDTDIIYTNNMLMPSAKLLVNIMRMKTCIAELSQINPKINTIITKNKTNSILRANEIYEVYTYIIDKVYDTETVSYFKLIYITKFDFNGNFENVENRVNEKFKLDANNVGIQNPKRLLNQCKNDPDTYIKLRDARIQLTDRLLKDHYETIKLFIILNDLHQFNDNPAIVILNKIDEVYNNKFNEDETAQNVHTNAFREVISWITHDAINITQPITADKIFNKTVTHLETKQELRECKFIRELLAYHKDYFIILKIVKLIHEFKLNLYYNHERIGDMLKRNNEETVRAQLTEENRIKLLNHLTDAQLNAIMTQFNNNIDYAKIRINNQNELMKIGVTREIAENLLHESNGNLELALNKVRELSNHVQQNEMEPLDVFNNDIRTGADRIRALLGSQSP